MLLSFIWTSENLFQSCLIIFDFFFHWSDLQRIIFFSIPTFFLWISISFSLTNFLFLSSPFLFFPILAFSFFSFPRLFFLYLSSPFLSFLFHSYFLGTEAGQILILHQVRHLFINMIFIFILILYLCHILSYPILSSFLLSDIHRLLDILDLSFLDQYCSDDINVFDDK